MFFPDRNGTGEPPLNWGKNDIDSCIGFAYRLNQDASMVLWGGFGIFYPNPNGRSLIQPGCTGLDNILRRRNGLDTSTDGIDQVGICAYRGSGRSC